MIRALTLLTLLLPAAAAGAPVEDEYVRQTWPSFVCATPALPGIPPEPIPIEPKSMADTSSLLAPLRRDIIKFLEARSKAYGVYAEVMTLTRGHCPHEQFVQSMKTHAAAFERRRLHDLRAFPEKELTWLSMEAYQKKNPDKDAPPADDPFAFQQACQRPTAPPKIKLPVIAADARPEIKKILTELTADSEKFYQSQLEQYFIQLELMTIEQAYECRNVLLGYRQAQIAQYNAFYDRRADDLAKIAEMTTEWRLRQ
ncbi:MAG: hypothetical protein ABIJ96_12915 [Elusimicrobiota bacterium]